MSPPFPADHGPSRRKFLLGTGLGLVAGLPLGALGMRHFRDRPAADTGPAPAKGPTGFDGALGMPGPFRGRVVEVHHPGSVTEAHEVQPAAVRAMMDAGMKDLTGADDPPEAWRRLFAKDDVIGIKVNPVGHNADRPWAVSAISQPAVLLEVVRNLRAIGVPARNLIVFERYAAEFVGAGYDKVMGERQMDDVRWLACSARYTDTQVAIDGIDGKRTDYPAELLPHVVGYDPDAYVEMGFASPAHDPKDDRRLRSHLSLLVTRYVNKLITLPVLKDHRSAGVTLALKNLSHGTNNNVARSHIAHVAHGFPDPPARVEAGPNQCNTFIPTAVAQRALRQKATLHILDGLIGVYEGGPGSWNKTWATWRQRSLFFATDPVAMDHVGWDILDEQRRRAGWLPVAEMGRIAYPPSVRAAAGVAGLAARHWPEVVTLTAAEQRAVGGSSTEDFDRRQPEHVILAGTAGLGIFDREQIQHRRIVVRG